MKNNPRITKRGAFLPVRLSPQMGVNREQEIEANRSKLENAKARNNQFQIRLYQGEIERLGGK
jgi:hypothetical protein